RDPLVTGVQTCALPIFPDREGRERAEGDDACPDVDGGIHAGDEVLAGAVATVRREDGRQDRDAEDAAELAHGVVRAGGLALLLRSEERRVGTESPDRGA